MKFVKAVKTIHNVVKICVQSCGKVSDFFESFVEVKQGELLSPLLFIVFLNDLADDLRVRTTFDDSIFEIFKNQYYYSLMILYSWLTM